MVDDSHPRRRLLPGYLLSGEVFGPRGGREQMKQVRGVTDRHCYYTPGDVLRLSLPASSGGERGRFVCERFQVEHDNEHKCLFLLLEQHCGIEFLFFLFFFLMQRVR